MLEREGGVGRASPSQAPGIQTSLKTPAGPQPVSQNYSEVPQGLSKYSFQPLSPGVPGRGSILWGWEAVEPWEPRGWPGGPCRALPAPGSLIQPLLGSPRGGSPAAGPSVGPGPSVDTILRHGDQLAEGTQTTFRSMAGRGHTAVAI